MVGTRAPEELELDDRLLQENKAKVRTKRDVQQQKNKNNSPTRDKGSIIILIFLTLKQGSHSAI